MLMILARLVRSESFWAVAKVRSPHTGPGIRYIILCACAAARRGEAQAQAQGQQGEAGGGGARSFLLPG